MTLLTELFTSEFAIRPFLVKRYEDVLPYMLKSAESANHHVRRWASEGTRPILPWGGKVPAFIRDPHLTLTILEKLKYDNELYVRKSVANHLNDHTKNHPALVVKVLEEWEKKCPPQHLDKILWIKRHALRTLIKKGDSGALKLMGVKGKAKIKLVDCKLSKKVYALGEKIQIKISLQSSAQIKQKIIIDYGFDFLKNNGKFGRKIFKLKTIDLPAKGKIIIEKSHHLKKISTMKFYSGRQFFILQINGVVLKKILWDLK